MHANFEQKQRYIYFGKFELLSGREEPYPTRWFFYNQICKVNDLMHAIWVDKDIDTKKSLEALASHLRKKLAGTSVNVENIRGVGYRLRKEYN